MILCKLRAIYKGKKIGVPSAPAYYYRDEDKPLFSLGFGFGLRYDIPKLVILEKNSPKNSSEYNPSVTG
jgi:hypothetical protein